MSLLSDLYSGQIIPCEHFGNPTGKEYTETVDRAIQTEEELRNSLTEQQKEKLDSLLSERMLSVTLEVDRMFEYAFKLAFRLATEIFTD